MIEAIYEFLMGSELIISQFTRKEDGDEFEAMFLRQEGTVIVEEPVPFKITSPKFRGEHTIADFVEINAYEGKLISRYALNYLLPLISHSGRIIRATLDSQPSHHIFLCQTTVDAMIKERSTPRVGPDGIQYTWAAIEIDPDKIGPHHIFKLVGLASAIYVTDQFVTTCEENNLVGFTLRKIWTAAEGKVENAASQDVSQWLAEARVTKANLPAMRTHARKILRERQSASVHSFPRNE